MDDVFLAALLYSVIMSYFCIVEDTLNHFPYTVKLSKGILFGFEVEFVGIKITNNRNLPVEKIWIPSATSVPRHLFRPKYAHLDIFIPLLLNPNV